MRELDFHEIDVVHGAAGSGAGPVVLGTASVSGTADGPHSARFPGTDPDPMPTPAPSEI